MAAPPVAGGLWLVLERLRPGHPGEHATAVVALATVAAALVAFRHLSLQARRERHLEERVRCAEALAAEREKFARLVQVTSVVAVITDADGVVEWVNPSFTRLTGYAPEEAVGRRPGDLLQGPGTDPAAVETMRAGLRGARPFRCEVLNYSKSGRAYWLQIDAVPVHDPAGRLTHFFAIETDVTARKALERDLEFGRQRLANLVAAVPGVVFELFQAADGTRGFTFFSEGLRGLCGLEPGAAVQDPALFLNCVFPADRDGLDLSLSGSAAGMGPWSHLFRVVHPSGGTRWVSGRSVPLSLEDGGCRWTGILTDVTTSTDRDARLRKRQRQMDEVQRLGQIGGWQVALPGMALEISEVAAGILGLDLANPAGWHSRLEQVESADREPVSAAWAAGLSTGRYTVEYRIAGPGGRRWVREVGRTVHDPDGTRVAVEGTLQDISEIREAEENRRNLEAQLRQAQKLETLGTLAGGVAHDFNNLLTGISGLVEMGRASLPPGSEVRDWLDRAQKGTESARDLVQNLLTFARRAPEGPMGALDLARLVQRTAPLVSASVLANVTVKTELDEPGGWVFGDSSALQQVLMNLCINAAQAIGDRAGDVTIRVEPADGRVLLTVTDTGRGMAPETLSRVFDPFFTTRGPGQGTGLGLSVALGIVQSHGGTIRAASRPGQGSVFTVDLPRVEPGPVPLPEEPREAAPIPPLDIVVVDDEPSVRFLLLTSLRREGHSVVVHDDAQPLLEAMLSGAVKPGLVITDLAMPGMTGSELLEKVRSAGLDVPFIAMSGDSMRFDVARLSALGRVVRLKKPFTFRELHRALEAALAPRD